MKYSQIFTKTSKNFPARDLTLVAKYISRCYPQRSYFYYALRNIFSSALLRSSERWLFLAKKNSWPRTPASTRRIFPIFGKFQARFSLNFDFSRHLEYKETNKKNIYALTWFCFLLISDVDHLQETLPRWLQDSTKTGMQINKKDFFPPCTFVRPSSLRTSKKISQICANSLVLKSLRNYWSRNLPCASHTLIDYAHPHIDLLFPYIIISKPVL